MTNSVTPLSEPSLKESSRIQPWLRMMKVFGFTAGASVGFAAVASAAAAAITASSSSSSLRRCREVGWE